MDRKIETVYFPNKEILRLTRVAAYARVSTGKDTMLHSLSAQVSYYSNLIQNHPGWQYCGVYSDEAITGTKEIRIGFQKLLTECRNGNIDIVITKSISRFARNTVTLLETVRELKLLGVDVFFEEQNIHTLSSEGELMLTILASYAQEESLSASENQKWRIRKAFENGEIFTLRYMYGYDISKHGISINPEQAEIVRAIFIRVVEGESFNSISVSLNERNISCIMGGKWDASRIHDIVCNEKYTGNALLMKTYINNHLEKKKLKNNGEYPMFYAEDTHDAIIDMDTFQKAQEIVIRNMKEHNKHPKAKKTAFTGLIKCAKCDKNYRRCTSNGLVFWNCSTYVRFGKKKCDGGRIHESMLVEIASSVAPVEEILQIIAADNILTFRLKSGTEIQREWKLRSRSESWTAEMKANASKKIKEKG